VRITGRAYKLASSLACELCLGRFVAKWEIAPFSPNVRLGGYPTGTALGEEARCVFTSIRIQNSRVNQAP
jgi:hypothetical protein